MKKRRNKKRIIIAAVIVYFLVIGTIYVREVTQPVSPVVDNKAAEEAYNRKKAVIDAQDEAERRLMIKRYSRWITMLIMQ